MQESQIFQIARKLPQDQVNAYLAEACDGNVELISDIKELLAVNEEQEIDDQFPTTPTHVSALETERQPLPFPIIQRFNLLRILGRGGMGTVYLAEQSSPVRRQVAIKIIRSEFNNSQILVRFHQERQTLALMDHPHIAKVLEAGITEDNFPYRECPIAS